ncbi:putative ribosomal N-acetyltransferase YdaF [compost metagenome]
MYTCNGNIPVLEGPRLRLRRMDTKDVKDIFGIWSDPEVTRYMNISAMPSPDDVQDMIDLLNNLSRSDDAIRWGIELKSSSKIIGSCGLNNWQLDGAFKAEIGYELGREHWGQRLMTEALELMYAFAFDTMKINRLEALVDPRNESSQKLLESMGWVREGLLRQLQYTSAGYTDMLIYSLLYEDYTKRKAATK